jgi:hypothetical protein
MELNIEFNPSAFKHGVSEADIRWALRTKVYDGPVDDDPNKCAVIGFDPVGLPLGTATDEWNEEAPLLR